MSEFSVETLTNNFNNYNICTCEYLSPTRILEIACEAVIFDIDDTKIEGSGEFIHDGLDGRFALGLKNFLLKKGINFSIKEHWPKYLKCLGMAEEDNYRALANQIATQYKILINPNDIRTAVLSELNSNFDYYMGKVVLSDGLIPLLTDLKHFSIKSAVCTSSSQYFGSKVLDYYNISNFFDAKVFDAEKRIFNNQYSSKPIIKLLEKLSSSSDATIMVGDSMADYASASLAGLGLVIIKIPKKHALDSEKFIKIFLDNIKNWEQTERVAKLSNLIFVNSFTQIRTSFKSSHLVKNILITQ